MKLWQCGYGSLSGLCFACGFLGASHFHAKRILFQCPKGKDRSKSASECIREDNVNIVDLVYDRMKDIVPNEHMDHRHARRHEDFRLRDVLAPQSVKDHFRHADKEYNKHGVLRSQVNKLDQQKNGFPTFLWANAALLSLIMHVFGVKSSRKAPAFAEA
jgi:hypothetical protein